MEPRRRRIFADDFRAEAIALTLRPGATVTGVARDLGMNVSLLHGWLRKARDGARWRCQHGMRPTRRRSHA